MENVEWKPITGFEGHYEVSSNGDIVSIKHGKRLLRKPNKNLKRKGYWYIGLIKDGVKVTRQVHSIVAQEFLGHIGDGTNRLVVDHIDNNNDNNAASNLQIITNRENSSKDKVGGNSKYVGVCWHKLNNKYRAAARYKGKVVHLGYYKCEIEASEAYKSFIEKIKLEEN